MMAREGDLIETEANLIFDVKGPVHPPDRVVAFIRYFPDGQGKRTRGGRSFGKVYSLPKRYALLKERFPEYLVYDSVLTKPYAKSQLIVLKNITVPLKSFRNFACRKVWIHFRTRPFSLRNC